MKIRWPAAALVVVVISSCGAMRAPFMVGETPAQKFYEAVGYYTVMGELAIGYAQLPTARQSVRVALRDIAKNAHDYIESGAAAIKLCNDRRLIHGDDATCTAEEEELRIAAAAIAALHLQMQRKLVTEGYVR